MALELRDLRTKVTIETDLALEALARATCKDKAEIAREVLHRWALQQVDAASILQRLMTAEGVAGASQGR